MKNYFFLLLAAQSLIAMNDHQFADPREFVRYAGEGNIEYLREALRSHADINQQDPDTQCTALHVALWNYKVETAAFLLRHGASVYRKTRGEKTARHFLARHIGACYRDGMLICRYKPCAVAWPKKLLVLMNGECSICLQKIEEFGHVYDCGHVVHRTCVNLFGECTRCFGLHQNEPTEASAAPAPIPDPIAAAPASEPAVALEPEPIVPILAAAPAPALVRELAADPIAAAPALEHAAVVEPEPIIPILEAAPAPAPAPKPVPVAAAASTGPKGPQYVADGAVYTWIGGTYVVTGLFWI